MAVLNQREEEEEINGPPDQAYSREHYPSEPEYYHTYHQAIGIAQPRNGYRPAVKSVES